jgi:tRNA 2-thiouridine synthesizing protein A
LYDLVQPMKILDTTGLKCPLPVLKAKKALKGLPPGARLEVRATDPGAPSDFAAFCDATGDTLERSDSEGEVFVFVIRKAGS